MYPASPGASTRQALGSPHPPGHGFTGAGRSEFPENQLLFRFMVTIRCTITFPDGESVAAKVTSRFHSEIVPVRWSGAVDRVPERATEYWACSLEMLCQGIAKSAGAEVHTTTEGIWPVE